MTVTSLVLCVIVVLCVAFAAWMRYNMSGHPICFRRLDADENVRTGRLRYVEDTANIFTFPSFVGPTVTLNRVTLEVVGRDGTHLTIEQDGKQVEVHFSAAEEMAFTSWCESAPSKRQQSYDRAAFQRFISKREG